MYSSYIQSESKFILLFSFIKLLFVTVLVCDVKVFRRFVLFVFGERRKNEGE